MPTPRGEQQFACHKGVQISIRDDAGTSDPESQLPKSYSIYDFPARSVFTYALG